MYENMETEALEARLSELNAIGENPEERSNDELNQLFAEGKEIEAELESRKARAEQERRDCELAAEKSGEPIIKEERKTMFENNSPEYRAAWLKNLQGKELTAEERTAVTAGYTIPQITADKIVGKMELYPLLNAVDVMNIPGTVIIPVEGTINAASVVAMGTAATDSADTIGQVSLSVYKLIKTVEITADVEAMAIDAFENWLVERLANKIYRLATKMIAAGSGSSQPTGLTSISATGHTYTSTGITYADICAIIAALPAEYLPNASFVMSRATFFGGVLGMEDDNGQPIVVADRQAPAKYNILGFPCIIEDEISTDVVFGDLKEGYVWNFGKGVTVDRDESVGFKTGSVCFRGMALADGKPTGVGLVRYTKAV